MLLCTLNNIHILNSVLTHTEMRLTGNMFVTTTALLLVLAVTSTVNSCPNSDRAALLEFRAALNEPHLGIFNTWAGTDCCTNWYGVSCNPETKRVADIILRADSEDPIFSKADRLGSMTGSISSSICQLHRLTTLVVADWKSISGGIPPCLASLRRLRVLDLIGNKITGSIPVDIGNLSRLTVLNLADNEISGSVPASIVKLKRLMHLDLSNNKLCGEIPSDIGNLSAISRVLLNRNRFTGSIPISLSKIYRLADLDLSMNRITGSIPVRFGLMPVLSTLNLDGNRLSGGIPSTLFGNTSSISILNLSRNSLQGNMPDVFGPKSYFTMLDVSYNNLSGWIPKSLTTAKYIGHLDLSYNHFCGQIPKGSPFDHLSESSFANNDCLCGLPLQAC